MANLNTKTLAAGVGDILAVDGGITSSGKQIKDGDGTGCPFYITTTQIGIGTDKPSSLLDVSSTTGGVLSLSRQEASDGIGAGESLGILYFAGSENSGTDVGQGAAIEAKSTDAWVLGSHEGTKLEFSTTDNDSHGLDVRMTIDQNGYVGIGNTSPTNKLHIKDSIEGNYVAFFHNDGATDVSYGIKISAGRDDGVTSSNETTYISADDGDGHGIGSIAHNTSGNFVINATSDARLKKNIIDTKIVGLDILNAIKVREFSWIRKGGLKDPAGLIAQEVASVYPRAVSGSPDGDAKTAPMMISESSFIIPLIKAVQELSAKVTALESK